MTDLSLVYQGTGAAWARGPSRLYDRLAELVVEPIASELRGMTVLDVGAGTAAACRALRRAGATPIAFDAAADMLAQIGDAAFLAVTGDMCELPFLDHAFDAAVAAFAISHVRTPAQALAEMGRVVKPAGAVAATVFGAAPASHAEYAVDEVAVEFGYRPPDWYVELKSNVEPLTSTPELLRACAREARLERVAIRDTTVDSGLDTPEAVVDYRSGKANLAPFVDSLPADRRAAFLSQAVAAVAERGEPVRPRVLVLSSRAPA